MHPSLQMVERYDELLDRPDAQLPYDFRSCFPGDGFLARRANQKKLAFLKRIDDAVRAMLRADERVEFFTQAVLHSFAESYLLGLPMYYLNRRAIVLTTQRVLLVQIDSRRRPRELRAQLELGAVESYRRTLFGNTVLRLRSGAKYVFVHLPRRDRRPLTELTTAAAAKAPASADTGLRSLCPYCYRVVDGHPDECPQCRKAFKSWLKAGRLSLLFPGLGDIYLGHARFAVLEILVAGIFWLSVAASIFVPDPNAPVSGADIAVTALFGFVFLHGGDAAGTFHIARKGLYPAERS